MISRIRLFRFFILSTLIMCFGCEQPQSSGTCADSATKTSSALVSTTNEPPTHLLFAGIDVLSSPWQSSVQMMELSSGNITSVSSGESGDPMIAKRGQSIFIFNRSFDSQNFREIESFTDGVQLSAQNSYREAGLGDPHDILLTDEDTIVAANYTAGKITMVDRSCGAIIGHIEADWDLPEGSKLRPEALSMVNNSAGEKIILVAHQSLLFANGSLAVDGSQSVFVIKVKSPRELEVVDVNPDKPRIQGIALHGSLPQLIRETDLPTPVLISMCHRNLVDPAATVPCQSAIETIKMDDLTSEVLWNLDDAGLFMNGPAYGGADGRIFANVEVKTSETNFSKKLVELKLSSKESKELYSFGEKSGGFWGGFYDSTTQKIYVGDTDADGVKGRWIIIGPEQSTQEILLDYAPYSGSFIALP
jgi:hypothetical protein